ncbi:hypothetical protein [Fischerella thermalis]|uniref:hypothetical protein n=1 Tax=Fischerella thermalis TaxID=372787 RepID=UPI00307E485F
MRNFKLKNSVLKKNLWSDRLLADAKKLLATPEIREFLAKVACRQTSHVKRLRLKSQSHN